VLLRHAGAHSGAARNIEARRQEPCPSSTIVKTRGSAADSNLFSHTPQNSGSRMLKYLLNLRSKPPLERGAVRAGIFFVLLIPTIALFDYLVGTPIEWSFWTFVELVIASILYAVLMHYFSGGVGSSNGGSSEGSDRPPITTRSPR